MGLISRVSSRTYRTKKLTKKNQQKWVCQEMENMSKSTDARRQLLPSPCAKQAKDLSKSTDVLSTRSNQKHSSSNLKNQSMLLVKTDSLVLILKSRSAVVDVSLKSMLSDKLLLELLLLTIKNTSTNTVR